MDTEATKYFKYLDLVREDIREELDLLHVQPKGWRICDFGCGNGITTFGLALEADAAVCIGIDLFSDGVTPEKISQYIAALHYQRTQSRRAIPRGLGELIDSKRLPRFRKGNIVLNHNMPQDIDFAYCKKLLINLLGKKYEYASLGADRLLAGLRHIKQSTRPEGLICAIEYDREFKLEEYFAMSNLRVLRRAQIERREIRSRGRTNVISSFTLYLCCNEG